MAKVPTPTIEKNRRSNVQLPVQNRSIMRHATVPPRIAHYSYWVPILSILFRRSQFDADLEDEIRLHLELSHAGCSCHGRATLTDEYDRMKESSYEFAKEAHGFASLGRLNDPSNSPDDALELRDLGYELFSARCRQLVVARPAISLRWCPTPRSPNPLSTFFAARDRAIPLPPAGRRPRCAGSSRQSRSRASFRCGRWFSG
jgi:hypothetical protein